MMTLATIPALSVAIALGLGAPAALAAPAPTLSDIAGCNEQAAARVGASALPHPGSRAPETVQRDPGMGRPGEKSDPSGSIISETPDPLVKGMDAAKSDDPQYRAAYRECMRARLGAR